MLHRQTVERTLNTTTAAELLEQGQPGEKKIQSTHFKRCWDGVVARGYRTESQ